MANSLAYLTESRDWHGRWTAGGSGAAPSAPDGARIANAVDGAIGHMPANQRMKMEASLYRGGRKALVGLLQSMQGAQADTNKEKLHTAGLSETAAMHLVNATASLNAKQSPENTQSATAAIAKAITDIGPYKLTATLASAMQGMNSSASPPSTTYVDPDPKRWIGTPSVGDGWCVALVQKATGAPQTSEWRPGDKVSGNPNIKPGTAIATFEGSRYTNDTTGKSHAAIYVGQDATGIYVVDQYNKFENGKIVEQQPPTYRKIRVDSHSPQIVDHPENYNAITK